MSVGQREISDPPDPNHVDELVATIQQLSFACKQNVLALEDELADGEPDPRDRCGLLADRFEVFALTIPGCRAHRYVVSFDLRAGGRTRPADRLVPAMHHAVIGSSDACRRARHLVTRHRRLIDPSWEE